MAEERKESYTRLFNPILDALCRQSTEISASQYAIILFVIRSTYGWNKKKFPLSKSYIAEGTAMTERSVKKNITILVNKGYLIEYGTDRKTRSKIYGLNKRFSQWGKGPAILSEGERPDTLEGERSGSVQSDTLSVNGQVTEGARVDTDEGERLDTQKRHIQRKSIKEKEKKCSQNLPFLDSETGKWVMPEEDSKEVENKEVEEDENGDI